MKELTIEEKAKAYDRVVKEVKDFFEGKQKMYSDVTQTLEHLFPELAKSEDVVIKEKIIATIHLYYGEPLEDEAKEMIAWLEKQGEHAKFRDSIQVGDKVTRNEDGILVNLSQLNRVAKKDEKQGKQKPAEWSEEDENTLEEVISILEYQKGCCSGKWHCVGEACPASKCIDKLKSLRPQSTWKPSE